MTLITGGAKCGKSKLAEKLLDSFMGNKIYMAAMLPYGEEAEAAIKRHRKLRKGKGFTTIEKYTDILYQNVVDAVKDVYETTVKDIKGTDEWTDEKKNEVKEVAKTKAINALTTSAYQILKSANEDFEEYLDGLIGTALYDLKNNK